MAKRGPKTKRKKPWHVALRWYAKRHKLFGIRPTTEALALMRPYMEPWFRKGRSTKQHSPYLPEATPPRRLVPERYAPPERREAVKKPATPAKLPAAPVIVPKRVFPIQEMLLLATKRPPMRVGVEDAAARKSVGW